VIRRKGSLPLLILCLGAAALILRPLPFSPSPHDHSDTLFNSWLVAWNHHAVTHWQNPLNTPMFAGFQDARGRNDLLLTQWLASIPLRLFTGNPVRIHNLLLWLSLALSGFAAAKLSLDRGASPRGAAFGALAFMALPYFQSHLWHLQLFSAGLCAAGIMFALRTAEGRSSGWPLALFIPLQGLASLYMWYFLNLALLLTASWGVVARGFRRARGLILYSILGNLLLVPFLTPQMGNAARWSMDSIASTDLSAFLSPWGDSLLTGGLRSPFAHPEAALWPGLAVVLGAAWCLLRRRLPGDGILLVMGVFFAAFSLGPTVAAWGGELAPGPFRLVGLLPGGTSLRLPARAGVLTALPLVVLASRKLGEKPLWTGAGVAIVILEALRPGISVLPAEIADYHVWLRDRRPSRVLYLPVIPDLERPEQEVLRLYGSTLHFTPSVNGYSTSLPRGYTEAAGVLNTWPSAEAEALAESLGVETVVFEGLAAEGADMTWFDGRIWYSAVILRR
jgi:hypothetical protein